MKTVAIENLRRHLGEAIRAEEPVLVTRYGKLAGVFYPLPDTKKLRARVAAELAERAAGLAKKRRGAEPQLPLLDE